MAFHFPFPSWRGFRSLVTHCQGHFDASAGSFYVTARPQKLQWSPQDFLDSTLFSQKSISSIHRHKKKKKKKFQKIYIQSISMHVCIMHVYAYGVHKMISKLSSHDHSIWSILGLIEVQLTFCRYSPSRILLCTLE